MHLFFFLLYICNIHVILIINLLKNKIIIAINHNLFNYKKKMFGYILILIITFATIAFVRKYTTNNKLVKAQQEAKKRRIKLNDDIKSIPFKIEYDENEWNELKEKLFATRYFDGLVDDSVKKFEFGFDVDYAKRLINHWKNEFNWEKQVNYLNKYNHFKVTINDTLIHYMRIIGDEANGDETIPILMINGWPGSFYEFYKSIEILIEKNKKLDIIVASIPGYGFSSPLTKPINVYEAAILFDALMRHIYNENVKYLIHGEDWGSIIGESIAKLYPETITGLHITMPAVPMKSLKVTICYLLVQLFPDKLMRQEEKDANLEFNFLKRFKKIIRETGYMHLQATKPDTIGFALTDSPCGLMAYILEKYSSWSFNYTNDILNNPSGSLETSFNSNDLLTIITLYWLTNTITSSMRFYKCTFSNLDIIELEMDPRVALSVMYAQNELDHMPYFVLKQFYSNIKQYSIINNCGHFAAFHQPEKFSDDLLEFIQKIKIN